jgi:hypothetical protein
MGSRYTKSIPEKVFFQDLGDGWFGGPFVTRPKGTTDKILGFKLIPDTEYMKFVIPVGELNEEQTIECLKKLRNQYAEELNIPDAEIYLKPNEENNNS